jgi:hypothetical protein
MLLFLALIFIIMGDWKLAAFFVVLHLWLA